MLRLITIGLTTKEISSKLFISANTADHWHPLHCVVHIGTPGTKAFDNANNPVDIFRDGTFTGTCTAKPGNLP